MRVNLTATAEYVPKAMGNQELPSDEQVKVTYRLMTAEQEEKYSIMHASMPTGGGEMNMTVEPHAVEIWTDCVTAVTGLEDLSGKALTPKQALSVPGIYELISEVAGIIKQGLTEADSKN